MNILNKILIYIYKYLKIHKKKLFIFTLLTAVFFLIRFPYEEAMLYIVDQLKKKAFVQLKYESFYINPIGLALVFKKPEITMSITQKPFTAEQLIIKPSYKAFLSLRAGAVITLKWPGSFLQVNAREISPKLKEPDKIWLIKVNASQLNPAYLKAFSPLLSNIKGSINIEATVNLDPNFTIQPEAYWKVNGTNLNVQAMSYALPGNSTGSISLPSLNWGRINSQGEFKDGEWIITDTTLGEKQDAFQIRTRGLIFMDLKKPKDSKFSKKVTTRLKYYNLGLEIFANEDFKSKLYFLDMFFKSIESKTDQGWRYLAHIKGNATHFPDLIPVTQLPTLKTIRDSQQ